MVYKFNDPSLEPPVPKPRQVRIAEEKDVAEEPAPGNDQPADSRAAEQERRGECPQYLALETPPDPHLASLDYIIRQNQHTHNYLRELHDYHRAQDDR